MSVHKITYGYVSQEFDDDGKCISQEFIAGDQVDWEDDYGNSYDGNRDTIKYQPFDMIQPQK